MKLFSTIQRTDREAPNANGYFVQNGTRATVAGPFATIQDAWKEEDRRTADEAAVRNGEPSRLARP